MQILKQGRNYNVLRFGLFKFELTFDSSKKAVYAKVKTSFKKLAKHILYVNNKSP